MSEAKHTPGPWRLGESIGGALFVYGGGKDFDGPIEPHVKINRTNTRGMAPRDIRIANARLIAAAPDLLATLRVIADWPFDIMGDCVADARNLARRAIAKAEGRQ